MKDYTYYVNGQPITLKISSEAIAIRFSEKLPSSSRADVVERSRNLERFDSRSEIPGESLTVVPLSLEESILPLNMDDTEGKNYERAVDSLKQDLDIEDVKPVFDAGENILIPSDRVIFSIKSSEALTSLKDRYGLEIVEESYGNIVALAVGKDSLQLANELANDPSVIFAEPDFLTIGKHIARFAGQPQAIDPLIDDQYAVRIVKAVEAWSLVQGDARIRIAILDEGVDTSHSDLAASIVGTYDGTSDTPNQDPNPWDGHGTACAGLAAAIPNNDVGIKGVGAGCSILGVRIAYSAARGGSWVTNNSWIARSINWAWDSGKADVISNSWGGGAPSNAINSAFLQAQNHGRGGKGCAVVIAAGNSDGPILYPSNLSNLITVTASNEFDEPKTPNSRDGETWWGSCFGPQSDIAAPGVHNLTTDNSGAAGYDPGDFTPDFNGTSSSTPLVAGAIGLMFSANPGLSYLEVAEILRDTAEKVGGVNYGFTGHNARMGFGRLNVEGAVRAAIARAESFT
jgi:thermitase